MAKETLLPIPSPAPTHEQLHADLRQAQEELRVAEADLAAEQAAVNAFRMHARLMLDDLADAILTLRARKQSLLTALALQEAADDDPLGPAAEAPPDTSDADEDLPLPTPTPRDRAAEKRLYRELARRFHPDLAETAAELAYRTCLLYTSRCV